MAEYRDYALVGGIVWGLCGGLVLSLRPDLTVFGVILLLPALALMLYGLLTTPDR